MITNFRFLKKFINSPYIVTQLIDEQASNRKAWCGSVTMYPFGQAVYPLWWPSLTKDCKQSRSMLEW